MKRLQGKVAIVTGAGRHQGLGEAICRRFAEEGAHVVIADLATPAGKLLPKANIGTLEEMESVAASIREHIRNDEQAGRIEIMACDVRNEEEIKRTIAATVGLFGRLDIVVNNAGVGYIMKPLTDLTVEEWDLVLDVNLRGPFLFIKHAAVEMIKQNKEGIARGGRIINIASRGAKSPTPHFIAYSSSKHGMVGLTRVAAVELGIHGITVNAVCPNHVTTALGASQNAHRRKVLGKSQEELMEFRKSTIPLGRVGVPDDTANACVFLASDEADYITGEAMNVSGGEEMH